ncbi:MAG: AAA family ATPase [Nitrospirota bacterium]
MFLKNLTLRNMRNYKKLELALTPGLNLFYGGNAQGKTNLLEAACLLASLRSFRGVKPFAAVSWDAHEGLIQGEAAGGEAARNRTPGVSTGHFRIRRLKLSIGQGERKVLLDGKRPESAADYLLSVRVISFSPEDLFLVKEYPSSRRRFLDRSVFHLRPSYLGLVNQCRAASKQLNSALKGAGGARGPEGVNKRDLPQKLSPKVFGATFFQKGSEAGGVSGTSDIGHIKSWEEAAAPLFAEVTLRRRERAETLAPLAGEIFEKTLGGGRLALKYRSAAKGADARELTEDYLRLFEKRRPEGMKRRHSLVGPHTDDLEVLLDGREMKLTASRGQGKLALLSLVLADAVQYKESAGEYPVLLFDDAGSELDESRLGALLEMVSTMGQALITSTDGGLLGNREGAKFKVETDQDGARVSLRI